MNPKFLKVKCAKCKNEQIIFKKASTIVNCLVCNEKLSKPSGGNAHVSVKSTKKSV